MKTNAVFAVLLGAALVVAAAAALYTRTRLDTATAPTAHAKWASVPSPSAPAAESGGPERAGPGEPISPRNNGTAPGMLPEQPTPVTNKLERLAQIRESLRALAGGDALNAIRAAKDLTNDTERETALLTLVTEWTGGELGPARLRAQFIAALGLEAGLGMELVRKPELAVQWANELTDGAGKSVLLQSIATSMAAVDPVGGLAMSAQVPEEERRKFSDAIYARWAADDTAAALRWVDQVPDAAERNAALQAVRQVAPVGIGAEMRMQDGYAVINRVLPDTPADVSGQLHAGDRIVGLAQGDSSFVDARGLSLQQIVEMIRGAPGTSLQLQVLPAEALPNSMPQTVVITRDQLKFKK